MNSVQINDSGAFIASIPALMGFTPADSVVIVTFTGDTRVSPHLTMRIDLAQLKDTTMAEQLGKALARQAVSTAIVVVVGGTADSPDPTGTDRAGTGQTGGDQGGDVSALPHYLFVTEMRRITDSLGVRLAHAMWVDRIEHGQPWRCYDDPACAGTVPDPRSAPLAVATIAEGQVTYTSRADLAAQIAADPEPDLDRRTALLRRLPPVRFVDAVALIRDTIHQIHATQPFAHDTNTDTNDTDDAADADGVVHQRVVWLAHALTHPAVRDASTAFALTHPAAAERLWTLLTRATPRPEVTHPATLLAISAALRGDGALANIALDTALAADPNNNLAHLLRRAVNAGIAPTMIRQLLTDSVTT